MAHFSPYSCVHTTAHEVEIHQGYAYCLECDETFENKDINKLVAWARSHEDVWKILNG